MQVVAPREFEPAAMDELVSRKAIGRGWAVAVTLTVTPDAHHIKDYSLNRLL
jgi:hypothetical protein